MTALPSNNLKDFIFHGIIGSGSFSTCYKVSDKNGVISVWKAIDYGWMLWKDKELLLREIATLCVIKHPSIVPFYSYTNNKLTCNVYIQMEFCSGGTLMDLIMEKERNKIFVEESFIWEVLFKLLKALRWLHSRLPNFKIIHWSITSSHIFLDEFSNVKLGGFNINENLLCNYGIPTAVLSHLSLIYSSPEVLSGRKYTEKALTWSLGCLIHELATLYHPYSGSNSSEILQNIFRHARIRIPCIFSEELQKIIDVMLVSNPDARPTIEDIEHHSIVKCASITSDMGRIFINKQEDSVGKENMMRKCKLRICRNCLSLEQKLNMMKLKEATIKLKECRLKERELSVVKREIKVSHLISKKNERSSTLGSVNKSPLINRGCDTNNDRENNSSFSGDIGVAVFPSTSTKLDPNKIRRPKFVGSQTANKTVHFELQHAYDTVQDRRNIQSQKKYCFTSIKEGSCYLPVSKRVLNKVTFEGEKKAKSNVLKQPEGSYATRIVRTEGFIETHFL